MYTICNVSISIYIFIYYNCYYIIHDIYIYRERERDIVNASNLKFAGPVGRS